MMPGLWLPWCGSPLNAGDEGTDTSRKNSNKSSDSKILFGGETFFEIDKGGEEAQVGINRASALHLQSVTIYKSQ